MNAKKAPPEAVVDEGAEEERVDVEAEATEPKARTPEFESSDDDQGIGARVTAVFTAAEKAGQHIVTLAREEAEDIRREARAEAEAYLREQKLQADKEVEQIFAEARRKAQAIEEEARGASRQVEDDARVRKERLREEARLIEERVAWAKEGLAEVDERLQQVFLENEPLALQAENDS
jgi:F0F1-type ATP synthase membrane subunit b/b'